MEIARPAIGLAEAKSNSRSEGKDFNPDDLTRLDRMSPYGTYLKKPRSSQRAPMPLY